MSKKTGKKYTAYITYTVVYEVGIEADSLGDAEDRAREVVERGNLPASYGDFSYKIEGAE